MSEKYLAKMSRKADPFRLRSEYLTSLEPFLASLVDLKCAIPLRVISFNKYIWISYFLMATFSETFSKIEYETYLIRIRYELKKKIQ